MENQTNVQLNIPLPEVPRWFVEQVEQRAFKILREAQEELSHLISQQREQKEPSSKALIHHIEQCRSRLHDTDMVLQDVHVIIAGFDDYCEQEGIAEARSELDRAKDSLEGLAEQFPHPVEQSEPHE